MVESILCVYKFLWYNNFCFVDERRKNKNNDQFDIEEGNNIFLDVYHVWKNWKKL